jgi:hypothetical protein
MKENVCNGCTVSEAMRISIALCTWNGAAFLEEQLASLAAQTRQPDEVIVCDDASTDESAAIVDRFAALSPRLSRNPARLGTVRNFEQAIAKCSRDVIFLCDQDDVWRRDKIEVMTRAFEADENLACLFSNARRMTDTTLWDHIGFRPRERRLVGSGRAFDVLVEHNVVTGATMAFRSRWRDAILPIPEIPGMLHDQWIATVLSAVTKVRCIDAPLIDYREHDTQQVGAGAAAGGLGRWVGAARGTGAGDYARHAMQLVAVLHRLEFIGAPRERIEQLRGRIAHLRTRASLPERRLSRIGTVIRELASFRYHRYSNHFWSAAKDLFW